MNFLNVYLLSTNKKSKKAPKIDKMNLLDTKARQAKNR